MAPLHASMKWGVTMRNKIGFRWFLMFGFATALGVGGFVACGGSDPQDVIVEDSGAPETGGFDTKPPEDTGSKEDTGGPKDAAPDKISYDAGTVVQLDGGDAGNIPCFDPGELEEEPNQPESLANVLRPTRCGIIVSPNVPDAAADAASSAESDFLKFNLSDASTGFYLQFTGKIKMVVRVKGQSYTVSETESPVLPFHKNELYTVEVLSADGKEQKWTVTRFEFDSNGKPFLPDGG
jgi:hypothetical protein